MSLGQVDGQAGAHRLLAAGRWESGMCLQAVWDTSGAGSSDSPGSYESARDWWARCPADRKHGDRNPPAGALLRFSNGNLDGHICYSLGGEPAASTDKPSAGRTGVTSISEIERSWGGRVYEGWTDWLGGWDVITASGAPVPVPNPAPKKALALPIEGEEEMSTPSYVRGDQLDVVYACYDNATVANAKTPTGDPDSGAVYFGRRLVSDGERAVLEAFKTQTGHFPNSDQKEIIQIPQATFDAINKFAYSA